MPARWHRWAHTALAYLPCRSPQAIARQLILRANAARDGRQWQVAAALYEEALRLTPTSRIHKQCGHMYKEVGLHEAAELHYRSAERLDPGDADLALQIGHFEKIRGNLREAEAAYRRALTIKPRWDEPLEELARLSPGQAVGQRDDAALVPELLPTDPILAMSQRETIQIRRLGRIAQGIDGYGRVLQGVEAIRGFCVAATRLTELVILRDSIEIGRTPLVGEALSGDKLKHAFNVWLDFSTARRGQAVLELRFLDHRGSARVHRATAEIIAPAREADHPDNDAVVDSPVGLTTTLAAEINGRPSVIRSSNRAPLSQPINAIYVQRIDQLGDLIVSAPALARLRELFSGAHITLVVSPANVDFAHTLDMVNEVQVVEVVANTGGRRAVTREAQQDLAARLADRHFDLAVDFGQGTESRPLLRLSRASFTYGFRSAAAPWLSAAFDLAALDPFNGLEICSPSRKLLAMVDGIGRMHGVQPSLSVPPINSDILAAYGLAGRSYVTLHAGARLQMNRWPYFDRLAEQILTDTTLDVVVMGTELKEALAANPRVRLLTGLLPFDVFDALIASSIVFVGNDSGPKHLAAVRGTPTISLHVARLNWSEWGQEGTGAIISRRVPCAGCAIERDAGECAADFACLRHILPGEVLAEVIRLAEAKTSSMPRLSV